MIKEMLVLLCLLISIISNVHGEFVKLTRDNYNNCSITNEIEYGEIRVDTNNSAPSNETLLMIKCIDGFKAYPGHMLMCREFNSTTPKCIKTCPSVANTTTAILTCKYNNVSTSCERPYVGTVVIFECRNEYYENRANNTRVFTCRHGKWSAEPYYKCEPVCGIHNASAIELVIGGKAARWQEFPWHLGIYKGFYNICDGILITSSIVLSAAHCFKRDDLPKLYSVAGDKVYRDLSNPNDAHRQYRTIVNISKPVEYYEEGDSRNDQAPSYC